MSEKSKIITEDSQVYFMLTKPQRVTRAMHSLEGLLKGIAIDGEILLDEVATLKTWLEENQDVLQHDPFNELKTLIDQSLEDGFIDDDEKKDILWFCEKFTSSDNYFSAITSDLQRLHGILGGIMADNIIEKKELDGLKNWLDDHNELRSCWPFGEINKAVTAVLEDGKIDEQEHDMLLSFFGEFFRFSSAIESKPLTESAIVKGICLINPEIVFEDRTFCFTGSSSRTTRDEIESIIIREKGDFSNKLEEDINYLVIGANGSPCWTFACYGRKVEQAIEWQKNGSDIQIVHENDFWKTIDNS